MSARKTASPKPEKKEDPFKEVKALVERLQKAFDEVLDEIIQESKSAGGRTYVWIAGVRHEFTLPTMTAIANEVKTILKDLVKKFGTPAATA